MRRNQIINLINQSLQSYCFVLWYSSVSLLGNGMETRTAPPSFRCKACANRCAFWSEKPTRWRQYGPSLVTDLIVRSFACVLLRSIQHTTLLLPPPPLRIFSALMVPRSVVLAITDDDGVRSGDRLFTRVPERLLAMTVNLQKRRNDSGATYIPPGRARFRGIFHEIEGCRPGVHVSTSNGVKLTKFARGETHK